MFQSSEESSNFVYTLDLYEIIEKFSKKQFYEAFRANRYLFEDLLCYLKIKLPKNKDIRKELSLFLFFCTHRETYREMREIFGLPKSTINDIIERFSIDLYQIAVEEIRFPEFQEFEYLKRNFIKNDNITM